MRSLKNLGRFVTVGACLLAFSMMSGTAEARPKYMTGFKALYAAKLSGVKITCACCHPTKSKKDRNDYGAALGKVLTKKNETDADKIKAALGKIEKEKSGTDGKTFIDLIEDGKLPGGDKAVK